MKIKSSKLKIIIIILIVSSCLLFKQNIFNVNNLNLINTNSNYVNYHFRNEELLIKHFNLHGKQMGFNSYEEYEEAANGVINSKDALYKKEKEDNDDVYYLPSTNEIVFVSNDGYIRTYFKPEDGLAYFNRQ